jgi:medium-chain acyl-[acyl-carrier-protein] hydrolase
MLATATSDSWVTCPRPNPNARTRLFCFPYAGSGASIYRTWPALVSPDVEVCPIQLPGRENRLKEPPFTWLAPLIQKLGQALAGYLDRPYAFFGHSMGVLVSFELARYLRRQGQNLPIHLFVLAHHAPQVPYPAPPISQLPTALLTEQLRLLEGTPEEVLQSDEIMRVMLPVLRSDFALCEMYTYHDEEPFDCSISVFGGSDDPRVRYADLVAWQQQTTGSCALRMFPGGHFFWQNAREPLVRSIDEQLLSHPSTWHGAETYGDWRRFAGLANNTLGAAL